MDGSEELDALLRLAHEEGVLDEALAELDESQRAGILEYLAAQDLESFEGDATDQVRALEEGIGRTLTGREFSAVEDAVSDQWERGETPDAVAGFYGAHYGAPVHDPVDLDDEAQRVSFIAERIADSAAESAEPRDPLQPLPLDASDDERAEWLVRRMEGEVVADGDDLTETLRVVHEDERARQQARPVTGIADNGFVQSDAGADR